MRHSALIFLLFMAGLLALFSAQAQVLPDDRFDVMYHSYDGGGVKITGPSLLARKKVTQNLSVSANYYVDSISSASIDVESYASPYKEERTEISVGADLLVGDTIISTGYTNSDENDFTAKTAYIGISQEVFGGLTTIDLSYARGWDDIGDVTDLTFEEEADRRVYKVGLSQVITKNFLMTFELEGRADEGFLNNPYRQVRYEDAGVGAGFQYQSELYPSTRNSSAVSVGARYYVAPFASAIYGSARGYDDSWGITAANVELGYVFPFSEDWLFDASYRYYTQDAADFYSDLFPFENAQNFLGRDKEISTFNSHALKLEATYDFDIERFSFLKRSTLNFSYNRIMFSYDDFREIPAGGPVGEEPFYEFDADVIQLYLSFWL